MAGMRYQPQGNVHIDWANPITRGIGAVVVPSFPEVVGGGNSIQSGGFSLGVGRLGKAAIGPASQVPGFIGYDLAKPVVINGDYSLFILAESAPSSGSIPTHSFEGTGIGNAISITGSNASAIIDGNSTNTLTGDFTKPTLFVATRVGNQCFIYANGVKSASAITGQRTGVITGINFGRDRGSSNNPNKTTSYMMGVVPRAFSDAEIQSFSTNPWQLFRAPDEEDYVLAAGGTSYSYTATGGFVMSGAATKLRGIARTASGGIATGGAAAVARGAQRTAVGGLSLGGAAIAAKGRAIVAAGGLALSGAATKARGIARAAAGGITLAGAAGLTFFSAVQSRVVNPVGGMVLAGAAVVARSVRTVASGGLTLAGHAVVKAGAAGGALASLLPWVRRRRR